MAFVVLWYLPYLKCFLLNFLKNSLDGGTQIHKSSKKHKSSFVRGNKHTQ